MNPTPASAQQPIEAAALLSGKHGRSLFQPENRKSRIVLCVVLWSIISYLIISNFFLMAVEIKGASMSPTLLDGEKHLLYRFQYLYRSPKKGEIVVIRDPEDHGLSIKRIIALPHELMEIRRDGIYINGGKLPEPYLTQQSLAASGHKLIKPTLLGANEFYVMGDNRDYSADSRIYGPVPRRFVLGHITER